MMCTKCSRIFGGLILATGLGFLLVDLGVWSFGGIQWWTALFIIIGVAKLARTHCPECNADKKK